MTLGSAERPQGARHLDYPDWPAWRILQEAAERSADRPALRFIGRRLSYRTTWQLARQFASGLVALGLAPGDRVALVLPNSPQMVVAYHGVLRAGGIVVPTNPLYTAREFEVQMKDAKPRFVVALDLVAGHLQGALGGAELIVTRVREYLPWPLRAPQGLLQPGPKLPAGARAFQQVLALGAEACALPPAEHPEDVAVLQYTGGTTGEPKGAMLTHRNVVANALQCLSWMPSYRYGDERVLAVLPFFHVFGMTVAMNLGLLMGAEIDLIPRFSPGRTAQEVRRFRPTVFPGVPAMYQAVVDDPHASRWDLRSVRDCISGSAPLPPALAERFEQLTGGRVVEGYGLTEASPVTHCNPLSGERKPGTVGVPFPDTEARIVDPADAGRVLAEGEIGEIAVRGPQVMLGYYGRPEETQKVVHDGWLLTGDLGSIDADGFLRIVDRKKDLIIVSGFNVYPREVEEVLQRHPGVREVAVVGIADARRGQAVRAVVVPAPGWAQDAQELRAFCRRELAGYKTPEQFEFRTELPRSTIGKVLRRVIAAEAERKEES